METVYIEAIVDHLFSAILFGNRCAGIEQKNIDPLIRALTNDEAETHAYMCELQYDCLAFIGQEHFTTPFLQSSGYAFLLAVQWFAFPIGHRPELIFSEKGLICELR